MKPAASASATVGYFSAAARAATSCMASSARVFASSGRSGISAARASSMLHEPGAAPGAQSGGSVVGVVVGTKTVLVFVTVCADAAAYAPTAVIAMTTPTATTTAYKRRERRART